MSDDELLMRIWELVLVTEGSEDGHKSLPIPLCYPTKTGNSVRRVRDGVALERPEELAGSYKKRD